MSASVIELLQSSIDLSVGSDARLKEFLESCNEQGIFYYKENSDLVVRYINSSLNSSFDREKGLVVLLAFLQQIPADVFSNHVISWMITCQKIVSSKGSVLDRLALQSLAKLITLSLKFPDANKETGKQIVPKFLIDHIKRRESGAQVSLELLQCLQACLAEYPGPAGEFRTDVLRLLSRILSGNTQREAVKAAASCLALVPRLGGGGKQGVTHKSAWRSQQLSLITQLHFLLNQLYEHVDTSYLETPIETPILSLEPVKDQDALIRAQRLSAQFISVTQCLQAMLLESFPVAKSVAVDATLDVVSHAQRPTMTSLGSSREALAVSAVLPSVQAAAIRLIEALVLCIGRNLIPQAGLVSYLCSQAVVWTQQQVSDWPYAMDKPYRCTRVAVYKCLFVWLGVAGSAALNDTLLDKIVPVLLSDVCTNKPSVALRFGSRQGKGKKKQQMLVSQEDRSEKLGDRLANRQLCQAALQVLERIVKAVTFTTSKYLSKIGSTVLTVAETLPVPYSDADCLTQLYRVLCTLCLSPNPPPLAPALAILKTGLHHNQPRVRAECETALLCLEKIIRPTAASLQFLTREPPPAEEERPAKRPRVHSNSELAESHSTVDLETEDSNDSIKVIDVISVDNTTENIHLEYPPSSASERSVEILDDEKEEDPIESIEVSNDAKTSSEERESAGEEPDDDIQVDEEVGKLEQVSRMPEITKNMAVSAEYQSNDPSECINKQVPPIVDTPEDGDVSDMLMDFNDEVDDNGQ